MTRIFMVASMAWALIACTSGNQELTAPPQRDVVFTADAKGCPVIQSGDPVNTRRNGKIKWTMDNSGEGSNDAQFFNIEFATDNPTKCKTKTSKKRKNDYIRCQVRSNATPDTAYCYDIVIYSKDDLECRLDPTIFVNGMSNAFAVRECDMATMKEK